MREAIDKTKAMNAAFGLLWLLMGHLLAGAVPGLLGLGGWPGTAASVVVAYGPAAVYMGLAKWTFGRPAVGYLPMGAVALGLICVLALNFTAVLLFGGTGAGRIKPQGVQGWAWAWLGLCLLPALLEELVFRGGLLRLLVGFGKPVAIVASAVAFALLHSGAVNMLVALGAGLVLGLIAARGRLVWCMVIHLVTNALALLSLAWPVGPEGGAAVALGILGVMVFAACMAGLWRVLGLGRVALKGVGRGLARLVRVPAVAAAFLALVVYNVIKVLPL